MIVRMSHYGLKSSVTAFCERLNEILNDIGFLSTQEDPDVWYRSAVRTTVFSTTSTSCVTSKIYYVYHMNWALCLNQYRMYSNSKAIIWISLKYLPGLSWKYDCILIRRLVHVYREVCYSCRG